jgi:hypothetical protein
MRKVPTPSGRFAFQLYFDDLGEIDEICLQAIKRQSLWIERFVEKQFRTALRYEELGPDILGCTIFNSSGAVDAIVVSRSLEVHAGQPLAPKYGCSFSFRAGPGCNLEPNPGVRTGRRHGTGHPRDAVTLRSKDRAWIFTGYR